MSHSFRTLVISVLLLVIPLQGAAGAYNFSCCGQYGEGRTELDEPSCHNSQELSVPQMNHGLEEIGSELQSQSFDERCGCVDCSACSPTGSNVLPTSSTISTPLEAARHLMKLSIPVSSYEQHVRKRPPKSV